LEFLFINDRKKYNDVYRKDLMNYIRRGGYSVGSLGIFDGVVSTLKFLILSIKRDSFLISSNLKANVLCLFFYNSPIVLIVNGLGRKRKSKLFRLTLLALLRLRRKTACVIFQNYADYRFYRLQSSAQAIHWVPGSGGTYRKNNKNRHNFAIVQRDNKLTLVSDSIREFIDVISSSEEFKWCSVHFKLVGCSKESDFVNRELPRCVNVGRRPQNEIFKDEGSFLQPEGYGEGIPHTLVDAISSDLNVFIKKIDYIRYGLHTLGIKFKSIRDGWGKLEYSDEQKYALSLSTVNKQYYNLIVKWLCQ
jgi:hypothetical protein